MSIEKIIFPMSLRFAALTVAAAVGFTFWRGENPSGNFFFFDTALSKLHSLITSGASKIITGGGNSDSVFAAAPMFMMVRTSIVAVIVSIFSLAFTNAISHELFKQLLSYQGWLLEARGKVSTKTKIWAVLMKFLFGKSKEIYAYQSLLPNQPVPELKDTVKRYLLSMEPIVDEQEHRQLSQKAETFLKSPQSKQLQQVLLGRAQKYDNYVTGNGSMDNDSDWWTKFVYLKPRSPLMVLSNYYAFMMDVPNEKLGIKRSAARAAFYLHCWVKFSQEIEQNRTSQASSSHSFEPQNIQGVPLCMYQYHQFLSITQIAKKEKDELKFYNWDESHHVVVIRNGRYYRVDVLAARGVGAAGRAFQLASASQIELAFDKILEEDSNKNDVSEAENLLWTVTAGDRSGWSSFRELFINSSETNRDALKVIETSLMVIVFDDVDETDPMDLNELGKRTIHGYGKYPRWFDKSITMVVSNNGVLTCNCNHSFCDAPSIAHVFDACMAAEVTQRPYEAALGGRVKNTIGSAVPTSVAPLAKRIAFSGMTSPSSTLSKQILSTAATIKEVADDFDLEICRFSDFGKNLIARSFKLSPDAFVQCALQCAYYKLSHDKKFPQTYESASARLFIKGRTETIRACTNEMAATIKAFCSSAPRDNEKCMKLFRTASDRHSSNTTLAMAGQGVDRHLFALYVAAQTSSSAENSHMDCGEVLPFLQDALGRGWQLSSSQVPVGQANWKPLDPAVALKEYPRANGGFGYADPNGYGCSYVIVDDRIIVHCSSSKKCKETDSKKMLNTVFEIFREFKTMFEQAAPKK